MPLTPAAPVPFEAPSSPPLAFEGGDDSAELKAKPSITGGCNAAAKPACPESDPLPVHLSGRLL